jgi:hypothetical protein
LPYLAAHAVPPPGRAEAELAGQLANKMVAGELIFPLKYHFLPPAAQMFSALTHSGDAYVVVSAASYVKHLPACDQRSVPWGLDGQEVSFVVTSDAYQACDCLADHYTEEVRMDSQVVKRIAPSAAWRDLVHAPKIAAAAIQYAREKERPLDALAMREGVYGATAECTQFKPSLARRVYTYFEAKVALDPFAGWGDRAIGAAAAGVKAYYGVDPNPRLHPGYERLRDELVPKGANFQFFCVPFEEYVHTGPAPDLVFGSPPFHRYELYATGRSKDPGQCYELYGDLEQWIVRWLLPAVGKMWTLLASGGRLVLYMADTGSQYRVCGRVVAHLSALGARMRGVIGCRRGKKRPLPLWVWAKDEPC